MSSSPRTERTTARPCSSLTRQIERALGRVTISYDSWEEAHLIRRGATLFGRDEGDAAGIQPGWHSDPSAGLRQGLSGDQETLPGGDRRRSVGSCASTTADWRSPDSPTARWPPTIRADLVARFVLGHLADLLLLLPVGCLGALVNWLPYRIPGWIARLLPLEEDSRATYKLMISIFLFPLVWLGLSRLAQTAVGMAGGTGRRPGRRAAVRLRRAVAQGAPDAPFGGRVACLPGAQVDRFAGTLSCARQRTDLLEPRFAASSSSIRAQTWSPLRSRTD